MASTIRQDASRSTAWTWTKAKAYYLLLQLGHLFFQLLEKGSLLRALALAYAKTSVARLWGGQDKLAQRLLEPLRYFRLPDATTAPACRISFVADTS